MEICDDDHDGIVFDGKICPLCEALVQIKVLDEEIADLKKEMEEHVCQTEQPKE